MIDYVICSFIFFVGLYAAAVKKHLVKKIIGLVIMEYSACLMIILFGGPEKGSIQGLVSVVLAAGIATTVMLTAVSARLYQRYGTLDTGKIRNLRG